MPDHEELIDHYVATLSAYVIRARRVAAHSLASDPQKLVKLASVELQMTLFNDGRAHLTWSVPPEEVVESAAARVRPLVLQSEAVHYSKVLKAIGYILRDVDDPHVKELLKTLRTEWAKTQDGRTDVRAYTIITEAGAISDVELGFAYIYGDVVHADPDRIAHTEEHGVVERYKAAVPLVAQLMINTIATLNFITYLVNRGYLVLPGEPFDRTVTITATEFVIPIQNLAQTSAVGPDLRDLNAVVGKPFTYDDAIEMWGQESEGPDGTAAG